MRVLSITSYVSMFQHAIHKHVAAKLGLMQIIHKTIDKEGDGSSQKLINDGFMYMSAITAKITTLFQIVCV